LAETVGRGISRSERHEKGGWEETGEMMKHIMPALALIAAAGGPAQAANAVDIGMPMALTGYLAAFDGHATDGAKLAAKLLNERGGAGGHPIELHILDNASNATTGVTVVNQLINKYNVAAIASGALSAQTVAIEPIVAKNKVPVITMSVLPAAEAEWTFSMALPPAKLLDLELGFADTQLKAKRIAFLYSQTPYGQIAAKIVADVAKKRGQEAVFSEGVPVGSTDLTPQIARLKEANPDAIVDFLTGPVHLVETKAAPTVGLMIPIVMAIDDATTFRQAADVYKDCYFVMSPIQTYPNVPDPEVAAATKRYLDAFQASGIDQREVGNAGEGWDLVHMYAQLFGKSPDLRGDALREALMHLDFVGAYGRYQYRADDHTGQNHVPVPMQITRFQEGNFQIVSAGQR
jgi:branched-chain amino acid transport system substrate-binding protein